MSSVPFRIPNRVLRQLYVTGLPVFTSRYKYSIFFDSPIPGYNLVQRDSLSKPYDSLQRCISQFNELSFFL